MPRLIRFLKKPRLDQRLLLLAAVLYAVVAVAVRLLPFAVVRRGLKSIATLGPRPRAVEQADVRVVRAVRTVAALWPGEHCLTEALLAQCLLARYRCETTLCFGVARARGNGRSFDAHAWLERDGSGIVGARVVIYESLAHPGRCPS